MTVTQPLMAGKRGLVMGVANDRSIAWGIARKLAEHGAEMAFTHQGGPLGKRVQPLAESAGSSLVLECDVCDDDSVDAVFAALKAQWDGLDFLVHAIAYSDREELKGKYLDTTRDNFQRTLDISCYSFTALARRAAPLMTNGGSLLTMTYYGAERVMPHYNVMGVAKAALESCVRYLANDLGPQGIRVNAISAGPIKTLAASGVAGLGKLLRYSEKTAPLRTLVTPEDVGNAALWLLSDWSRAVTGEVVYVDAGWNIMGLTVPFEELD